MQGENCSELNLYVYQGYMYVPECNHWNPLHRTSTDFTYPLVLDDHNLTMDCLQQQVLALGIMKLILYRYESVLVVATY